MGPWPMIIIISPLQVWEVTEPGQFWPGRRSYKSNITVVTFCAEQIIFLEVCCYNMTFL
jgi:hypothetical protein